MAGMSILKCFPHWTDCTTVTLVIYKILLKDISFYRCVISLPQVQALKITLQALSESFINFFSMTEVLKTVEWKTFLDEVIFGSKMFTSNVRVSFEHWRLLGKHYQIHKNVLSTSLAWQRFLKAVKWMMFWHEVFFGSKMFTSNVRASFEHLSITRFIRMFYQLL